MIWMSRGRKAGEKVASMGHVWDETLEELNNPLPIWWLYLFYATIIFGIAYLLLQAFTDDYRRVFWLSMLPGAIAAT